MGLRRGIKESLIGHTSGFHLCNCTVMVRWMIPPPPWGPPLWGWCVPSRHACGMSLQLLKPVQLQAAVTTGDENSLLFLEFTSNTLIVWETAASPLDCIPRQAVPFEGIVGMSSCSSGHGNGVVKKPRSPRRLEMRGMCKPSIVRSCLARTSKPWIPRNPGSPSAPAS